MISASDILHHRGLARIAIYSFLIGISAGLVGCWRFCRAASIEAGG
ncbi:hypothetical protein KCP70_13695 [Salmonella enterica subsp. enterica]|nr:hypothetical protein KCP70_13695 [Salmonella enterica subsp. enterica]